MSLKVTVVSAETLPSLRDESGQLDPYVAVKFRGVKKTTEKLDDTLKPKWNEVLEWSLKSPLNPNEEILLKIYDKLQLNRRREIGVLSYNVAPLLDQRPRKESLRLKPSLKEIKLDEWKKLRLYVNFEYKMDNIDELSRRPDKPSKFQVHVHIFEGRRLDGFGVCPAVTVTCDRQSQTTVTKFAANNPVFDEDQTFYFKTTPTELFGKKVQISVRDNNGNRSHVIGVFNIDIRSIYNEPEHSIFNKWLVLSDPVDPLAGTKGFLKVSVSVLGPGDDPLFLGANGSDDNLDIESNLLRSSGVQLQQATLVTRIYSAKDIPQVDPASITDAIKSIFTNRQSSHAADPYVIISYAGHSEQTSVKDGDQNPVWNEQINIGHLFPSVCEKLVLQIKDRDTFFSADDCVGTCCINIPQIAAHGPAGFLPCFGPSYINVYGSPQQGFSFFPDKYDDMNNGKMEGVAYRGRLLLEVETQLGDPPKKTAQSVDVESQEKIKRYLGEEREYVLSVVFNGASMIQTDHISFEVSIGNYAQQIKVSELEKDGLNYYSVNWGSRKPFITLHNTWEDCSNRIGALNIMICHLDQLEGTFSKVALLVKLSSEMTEDVAKQLNEFNHQFQHIIRSCRAELEKLPIVAKSTKLDKNLRQHRVNEMSDLLLTADGVNTKVLRPCQILERFATLLKNFRALANEPQNSIPDIIVWMLKKKERIAYCRIPSHHLMHSSDPAMKGKMCGKLQTLQLKPPQSKHPKGSDTELSCFAEMILSLGFVEQGDQLLQQALNRAYYSGVRLDTKKMQLMLENKSAIYELRGYLYQARDLYRADTTGLSDPYCIVSCCGVTASTRTVKASLTPKWNQTVALKNIEQYISPEVVNASSPDSETDGPPFLVAVQLFDRDTFGDNDYLGTVAVKPIVRTAPQSAEAVLQWHPVTRYNSSAGELLAAFELFKVDQGFAPETLVEENIPDRLLPRKEAKVVEVQCLGVREMAKYQFFSVSHPFVRVECEEEVKTTGFLKEKDSMFPNKNIVLNTELPVKEVYSPPLNILVYDQRKFGYTPLVGSHSITSLHRFTDKCIGGKSLYRLANPVVNPDVVILTGNAAPKSKFDWWSKYYASIGEERRVQEGYPSGPEHRLTIYQSELEDIFEQFSDTVKTFPLFSGKGKQNTDDSSPVGYFKGIVSVHDKGADTRVTGIPSDVTGLPDIYPQEVLIRIYVVKGLNLKPSDILGGQSDPYIQISIGDKDISDDDNYIPNELNPVFGRVFEVDAVLPRDYKLTVTVKDHDRLSGDDTIGSTVIDLENRFLSIHRPLIGLPRAFSTSGLNSWRDCMTPVDVLSTVCSMKGYNIEWSDHHQKVHVNGRSYELQEYETSPRDGNEQHRLALHVLQQQKLVPEHVETRTLYKPEQPGLSQGKLHMWVDIIPKLQTLKAMPPKVDITPRQPERYVFRVVVWSVADITLPGNQITGDFYVKGILNSGKTQKTDIHYLAFGGEGTFNWRFVFPFDYDPIEKKIIYQEKDHFYSLDNTEHGVDDTVVFQVWDNDLFSENDLLGQVEFSLHQTPQPSGTKRGCNLETLNRHIDLFKIARAGYTAKEWLPIYKVQGPNRACTGKLNIWMEMLTEQEAESRPAGTGRDEPNQYPELKKPERPLLRFNFFDSALKTFRFSVWKDHKCLVLFGTFCLVLTILFLLLV